MNQVLSLTRRDGDDAGYHASAMHPSRDCEERRGKSGFDKTLPLERMIELAHEIGANIIVKGGPNAKWYLKKFAVEEIDREIEKQAWRRTGRATMWVVEFMPSAKKVDDRLTEIVIVPTTQHETGPRYWLNTSPRAAATIV